MEDRCDGADGDADGDEHGAVPRPEWRRSMGGKLALRPLHQQTLVLHQMPHWRMISRIWKSWLSFETRGSSPRRSSPPRRESCSVCRRLPV